MEELRLIAGATRTPSLTTRDILSVIFRQRRVVTVSLPGGVRGVHRLSMVVADLSR